MSRRRLMVLVIGPVLIVLASMALTGWMRSDGEATIGRNIVSLAPGAGRVFAAETPSAGARRAPPKVHPLQKLCQETADQLRPKLGDDCHLIVRPPFVLGGDVPEKGEGSGDSLDRWHRDSIEPAARAMAHRYFKKPPTAPITVLLFQNEQGYNRYAKELFGDENVSVYGYYKPHLRTLVMNIGTGGGTLVHELTHALMDFDYPNVPDWFNEGLASLHEHCRFREAADGPWVEGRENWRLPALQKAIEQKRLRSLSSLIKDDDFRGEQEGLNYAQARYFCMYLQRKGLLHDFYKRLRANQKKDPLGHESVKQTFAEWSWEELDADFQKWAANLKR